jgi:hypothetical protein
MRLQVIYEAVAAFGWEPPAGPEISQPKPPLARIKE